jgi:multicomponent Na+:H+ antiporter subunit B
MSFGFRRVLFWFVGAGILGVLLIGFARLPDFGHPISSAGERLTTVEVRQRRATDVVTAVVLDYRGFDTLGEETILFAAAVGVALLLRPARRDRPQRPSGHPPAAIDDVVGFFGRWVAAPIIVLGWALVTNGAITPGGGFQGGATLATAVIGVWLMLGQRPFERLAPISGLDVVEGVGIAGYVAVGFLGLFQGAVYLTNVLPLGRAGSLLSAGFMPILNLSISLAVAAGLLVVVAEFLEQTLYGGGDA